MKPSTDFDPSDIYYELADLAHALEAIHLIVGEMSFATADGGRNHDLDRVYALLKISHREASRLHCETQVFDKPGTWKYVPHNGGAGV
jgi:trimethylamine:corrinoid methyltransferase-like protein